MAKTLQQDRWAEIEVQTNVLMEQIAHGEAEDLSAVLSQRQEELELFFQELDYSEDQLENMQSNIERLIAQNASLIDICREQQKNILNEKKSLNSSKEAIKAYETESANEES